MTVIGIGDKTPTEVRNSIAGFAPRYVRDWDEWLAAPHADRPVTFGRILRRWQATRPYAQRRTRPENRHGPPFLDELFDRGDLLAADLGNLTLRSIRGRSRQHDLSLVSLWMLFRALTIDGSASGVGISKAILLVTYGRIGPALDSQVRLRLGVPPPTGPHDWLAILDEVSEDLAVFEQRHGPLEAVAPPQFAHIEVGRLYDMALGPR